MKTSQYLGLCALCLAAPHCQWDDVRWLCGVCVLAMMLWSWIEIK